MNGASVLLEVDGLVKHYPARSALPWRAPRIVRAVDGVSFTLARGETLAIVGESGSGKSTTARLVLRLIDAAAGRVRFDDIDVSAARGAALRNLRRRMQIVFQDPYASLNPRMKVRDVLEEPLIVHRIGDAAQRRRRVAELLDLVQLSGYHADRYPSQFSGGQRQRIGIARALAMEPDLVVCDEPVSGLDVSIQAQVINLLKDLQARLGLSYLFISHDLAVVKVMADRVAVMYLGQIVELAPKAAIFAAPAHPYTRTLLAAIPRPDPHHPAAQPLAGDMPSAANPPPGCRFHTRCPYAEERCRQEMPRLRELTPDHLAACHFAETLPPAEVATRHRALSRNAALRLELYDAHRHTSQISHPEKEFR